MNRGKLAGILVVTGVLAVAVGLLAGGGVYRTVNVGRGDAYIVNRFTGKAFPVIPREPEAKLGPAAEAIALVKRQDSDRYFADWPIDYGEYFEVLAAMEKRHKARLTAGRAGHQVPGGFSQPRCTNADTRSAHDMPERAAVDCQIIGKGRAEHDALASDLRKNPDIWAKGELADDPMSPAGSWLVHVEYRPAGGRPTASAPVRETPTTAQTFVGLHPPHGSGLSVEECLVDMAANAKGRVRIIGWEAKMQPDGLYVVVFQARFGDEKRPATRLGWEVDPENQIVRFINDDPELARRYGFAE